MQKVIVNSTPMIILSKIGLIDVLHTLFVEIIIPQAVYDEITFKSDDACRAVKGNDWIKVANISATADRSMYKSKLHDGEVEVMILAQEENGDVLVIIDDNTAKKTAKYLGLKVTGTLGILLIAKRRGHIDSVKSVIDLMKRHGFFVSERIEAMALKAAGEIQLEVI